MTQYGTVVRTEALTPRIVRVTFGGEGLSEFTGTDCTDQYVNALFLPDGSPLDVPFDIDEARSGPPELAPRGRRETVRRWDATAGELTIDFATHGDEGYAGAWANRAEPGDRLQVIGPSGSYRPSADADWHLLVGDESALPAIGAAVDALPSGARAIVVGLVDDGAHHYPLAAGAGVEIVWVHRADDPADPDLLLRRVEDLVFPPGQVHAFVHGEAGEVRAIRKHLLADRGLDRAAHSISPYWRRAHTDEQWRQIKRDWIAASEADVPATA